MGHGHRYGSSVCRLAAGAARLLVACGLLGLLSACTAADDAESLFRAGDYGAALDSFMARAATGDAAARNFIGIHYYLGAGVPRDFAQAAHWFEQAALGENADGQRNLGIMYLRGLGVGQDYQRAYGWLYYAHHGGNRSAVKYLRTMADHVTPNAGMQARAEVADLLRARSR